MEEGVLYCNGRPVGAVYEIVSEDDGALRGAVFFKDVQMYRQILRIFFFL